MENRDYFQGWRQNFGQILNHEDVILIDTSLFSSKYGDLCWSLYEASSFRDIDGDVINLELDNLKVLMELFGSPKVLTIDEVLVENERVRFFLEDKLAHLDMKRNFHKKCKRPRKYQDNFGFEEESVRELSYLFQRLGISLRGSLFRPRDIKKYLTLEKITIDVAEKTGTKVSFRERYGDRVRERPRDVVDIHTDEKLAASALYLSCADRKNTGVITRDSDIERIIRNSLRDPCLNGLRGSSIGTRVYYSTDIGITKCTFDSTQI
ncbi:MAG: hypothetical protein Q8P81_02345 [Nanoarchaeota archaeon]|nr:hypothetical protein [Nanoarchaeota archaeon]